MRRLSVLGHGKLNHEECCLIFGTLDKPDTRTPACLSAEAAAKRPGREEMRIELQHYRSLITAEVFKAEENLLDKYAEPEGK